MVSKKWTKKRDFGVHTHTENKKWREKLKKKMIHEVKMEKHFADYRKFYTTIDLGSKKVAAEFAAKLSEKTGMKWRVLDRVGKKFKFETKVITDRKKRRRMMDKIIEIEI